MDFAFDPEQLELRAVVRSVLDRDAGSAAVRAASTSALGYDPALWRLLGEQVGVHALAIPEEHGGAGYGLVEAGLVLEELGAHLVPSPFLGSSILGVQAVLMTDDPDAAARLLPTVATGESVLAVGWATERGWWDRSGSGLAASLGTRSGTLLVDGTVDLVLDAVAADVLLVVASIDDQGVLVEVRPGTSGLSIEPLVSMDQTRRFARLHLDSVPGEVLGGSSTGPDLLDRLNVLGAAAVSVEAVGAAAACLADVVAYVKQRHQFGRAIGSFQAVKHRLADLLVLVETARSAAYAALWAVSVADPDARRLALQAKSCCAEAYMKVAAESVQLHGGVGITWEYDAQLHLKRAHSCSELFGDPRTVRHVLAAQLGYAGP